MFRSSKRVSRTISVRKSSWFNLKFIRGTGIFLLVFFLLGVIGWYLSTVKTDFNLKIDDLTCADETKIKQVLEKEKIKFYWLQSQEIDKKLRQQFPCINESNIEREFPKGIKVTLSGRKPLAVFRLTQKMTPSPLPIEVLEATPSTIEAKPSPSPSPSVQVIVTFGETFLIDGKGVGFAKGFREDLPLVNFVTNRFDIGDSIGAEVIAHILETIEFFQKQGIAIQSLELDQDKLTVKTTEEIVFSVTDGLERQGASLQLIWKQAKMNSKSVVKIDLRFDKPVVIYVPEKK
jgi:cell division septal protein FtsQ